MAELDREIATYDKRKAELERHHKGKWALIRGEELEGVFDTFENAANAGVERFGAGPFLIRKVGAPAMTLPASILYQPVHAKN